MPYGYGDAGLGQVASTAGRLFRSVDQAANENTLKTGSDKQPFEQKRWMRNALAAGVHGHERAHFQNEKKGDQRNIKNKEVEQEEMNGGELLTAEA